MKKKVIETLRDLYKIRGHKECMMVRNSRDCRPKNVKVVQDGAIELQDINARIETAEGFLTEEEVQKVRRESAVQIVNLSLTRQANTVCEEVIKEFIEW